MLDLKTDTPLLRKIGRHAPLLVLLFFAFIVVRYNDNPVPVNNDKHYPLESCPFLSKKEINPDEQRIAKHFSADTLPGLMRKGLIKKYGRNGSGTVIAVNNNLWKSRTSYFKQALLTEVRVYNKVNGFALSTIIIDSLSGKVYAQISEAAKIDIYD